MTTSKYKIAVVIPKYGTVGGAEKFAYELTERLSRSGKYDFHVFANKWESDSGRITFYKIPIIRFPRFLTTVSFAWFTRRRISKMNFDLVHTHDRIFDADMFTMHGVPHRTWVYDVRKKSMSLFDMATCRVESYLINNKRCRKLLPVSCMTKEKLLQNYDVEPDRIEVIHPGVDIETFEGLDREYCRREIRKEFDIGPSDIVILFVSMNFEIKGLDYVIDGIAKLKSLKPETAVKLLVVGKGNHDKFRKQAQDASAGKSIIFAGVRKEDLRNIYMASDIFMMLSRFDTFGISVLEAMAASLPVIVSGNVGAKDVIRESENGFVVDDPGNADEVCEKIAVVLDERTRSEMAREALKTALDNTWDKVADRVNSVYEELLSNGSR